MKLPFFIARRYLFSKKSHNVINLISIISMVAVGVGSFALIVVMSAFNGLEDLVASLYSTFDPDIKISIKEGKTFDHAAFPEAELRAIPGVVHYTRVIEETALLKYKDNQSIAVVKGVEPDFLEMSDLELMKTDGNIALQEGGADACILGYGIAYNLAVFVEHAFDPISVHAANREGKLQPNNPAAAFRRKGIRAGGIFAINPDFNDKYVLVPLHFAQDLFQYSTEVTGVEIGLEPGTNEGQVRDKIAAILGDDFNVKTRYQLNEIIYKTNETEKWIAFLIVTFILIIATFNIIGSLVMLIIEKKKDIFTLKSMGATRGMVKGIFVVEGVLITGIGGILGLVIGVLTVLAQQTFGLVELENVIVPYYPVQLSMIDLAAIFGTVVVIGFLSSWFPVQLVVGRAFERFNARP